MTRAQLERHGALDEHIDGLVEMLRRIDSVLIAVVFKETADGHTKISIRSDNHDIDVAEVMGLFGGGAAPHGGRLHAELPPEEAVDRLLPLLAERVRSAVPSLS